MNIATGCVDSFMEERNKGAAGGEVQRGITKMEGCRQKCGAMKTCTAFDFVFDKDTMVGSSSLTCVMVKINPLWNKFPSIYIRFSQNTTVIMRPYIHTHTNTQREWQGVFFYILCDKSEKLYFYSVQKVCKFLAVLHVALKCTSGQSRVLQVVNLYRLKWLSSIFTFYVYTIYINFVSEKERVAVV